MSASASLWPKTTNKDLIISVANYLQELLNENKSSLDEVACDSLQIATESLQTIICPDDDSLPKPLFTLNELYNLYKSNNNLNSKEEKEESKKQESESFKPIPSNIQKRREKFLEFIKVLKKHDFFKGCPQGSNDYKIRMEKARVQYNTRFPNMSIDTLQWLTQTTQSKQPMDTDNNNNKKEINENDKKIGEQLKGEGNKLLGQKQYQNAIDKYTQAIKYNPQNAVYFSNRAAAYTYLRNYKQAVIDAKKASDIDPNYVKAYVRHGLAEYEMGNYEAAHESYSKALNKTKSTDKNWETYMEKVELCQMKMDEANNINNNDTNNPLSGMGGSGGQPDLNSLFSGMGGAPGGAPGGGGGGLGGMDFSKIMQNPMMQQMAQQMMQDPNAMKKMGDLMKGFGGPQQQQQEEDGNNNDGNNNDGNDGGKDVNEVMADLLQNPEKAQRIFKEAMDDPEVKELMREDPTIEPLINRIKTGDYAAFMELGSKPQAIAKVKTLIQKYYNK